MTGMERGQNQQPRPKGTAPLMVRYVVLKRNWSSSRSAALYVCLIIFLHKIDIFYLANRYTVEYHNY